MTSVQYFIIIVCPIFAIATSSRSLSLPDRAIDFAISAILVIFSLLKTPSLVVLLVYSFCYSGLKDYLLSLELFCLKIVCVFVDWKGSAALVRVLYSSQYELRSSAASTQHFCAVDQVSQNLPS